MARLLRVLRRRNARRRGGPELTYREVAAKTGWSYAAVGEYFAGRTLPPTGRFDVLVQLLGAAPAEQRVLATARDRVEERRRRVEAGGGADDVPVPAQLPADVRGFAGRVGELAELDRLLADRGDGSAVVISALAGTAGVGKTALAVHWAHRLRDRFPDGQLYANLRGFDPAGSPVSPDDVVRGFLVALGVPGRQVPAGRPEQVALYRSVLADRRVLVVLDNARDVEQVRPLLPGGRGCLVVVTSRNLLGGLVASHGAYLLALDLLRPAEARELLAGRLGPDRVEAMPAATEQIIERCARLPLALAIVAARAAAHPDFPLASLAEELRDVGGRLDALSGGDSASDVRAVFSWSHRQLSDAAGRLFRLLGLHPGPDLTAPAAASLAGVPLPAVRGLLAELAATQLVTEHRPGRYTHHDLLRAYAAELGHGHEDEQRPAVHRLLDYYVHTACRADRSLERGRDPIALGRPLPEVWPDDIGDPEQALAWFAAEHQVLLESVRLAVEWGFDVHAWQLAWAVAQYHDIRGRWHDWVAVAEIAVAAADRLAEPSTQASMHRLLSVPHQRLGQLAEAEVHLRRALDHYGTLDDPVGQAHTEMTLGMVTEQRGDYEAATSLTADALERYRAVGHRRGEGGALNAIGWLHTLAGEHEGALPYCQDALVVLQEVGDRHGVAYTWDSLAHAHRGLGDHGRAVECYRSALRIYQDLDDRNQQATTLVRIGDTHRDAGQPGPARDVWRLALEILEPLDHPDAAEVRARLDQ